MKRQPSITLILPSAGAILDRELTLEALLPVAADIQLLSPIALPGRFQFPNFMVMPGEPPSDLPQLLNRSLPLAEGEFIAVLSPGMQISASLPGLVAEWGRGTNYLYGDYAELDSTGSCQRRPANCCPEDITEREDWGFLEIYRTAALRELGGCDESLRFRPDYDLRLKLTDHLPAAHLPLPICCVNRPPEATAPEAAAALFFPGRGKFGGFSYLFMSPEEEKEVEEIFYRMLRRRGAYLATDRQGEFPARPPTHPRVSVVIPVHNRASFLPLSVGSVQRGIFQDYEIIIVDNASTDDTLSVAQELAAKDSRIRVVPLSDNIIARALNTGVQHARGEYIAQLDSDDEYTPRTLTALVEHLDQHSREGLAISYYELMDERGATLEEFGIIKHLEYNRNNILRVDGAGAVRVWRKAAILEFGGFNEEDFGHYGEDYDLVLKVGEKYDVERVHEVLYRYRRHPGNSDVLRSPDLKISNKTQARQRALQRRQKLNQQDGA